MQIDCTSIFDRRLLHVVQMYVNCHLKLPLFVNHACNDKRKHHRPSEVHASAIAT
jgi:hypothetical protein